MTITLDKYTRDNMHKIKDLIGTKYLDVFNNTWTLHSCNDLGVPYFHKRNQKRLYTVSRYMHIDLLTGDLK